VGIEELDLMPQRKGAWKPKCTVSIAEIVLTFLEEQARCSGNQETGGIIAGLGSVEEGMVVISHASDGGPRASSSPTFFSRDTAHCQRIVDEWASHSSGNIDYLGEWHKHLEDDPKPSLRDLETLEGIARDPKYHVATALLLIIGNSNTRSSLRVFLIDAKGRCAPMDWQLCNERLNI